MTYFGTTQILREVIITTMAGLHDIGLLFMPDCFHESDTGNAPECECLYKELYRIYGAEHIGFMHNHVNKMPI